MTKVMAAAALVAAMLAHGPVAGATTVVEAVQYPAWRERGGDSVPLEPGMALEARDRVRTGPNARVRLQLAEGSAVKLGENVRFEIERAEERGMFRAALAVIDGAFRFTTNPLAPPREREVAIRVKQVSVGVRGTDLWGRASAERDFVVLLEGRISVASPGHPEVILERALDSYEKRPGADPRVVPVDAGTVGVLARETEIEPGLGAATGAGGWRAVAGAPAEREAALALQGTLRRSGYPARLGVAGDRFIVEVPGLASARAAQAVVEGIARLPGAAQASVKGPD